MLVKVVVEVDGVVLTNVIEALGACVVESSTTEVVETSVRKDICQLRYLSISVRYNII